MREFVHPHDNDHIDSEFNRFINKHGKTYVTSDEHENRKNIFKQNLRFIHSKNRQRLGFSLAINHLSDKTDTEIKALLGYRSSGGYNGNKKKYINEN